MFGYSVGTAAADMPACYSITGALGIPANQSCHAYHACISSSPEVGIASLIFRSTDASNCACMDATWPTDNSLAGAECPCQGSPVEPWINLMSTCSQIDFTLSGLQRLGWSNNTCSCDCLGSNIIGFLGYQHVSVMHLKDPVARICCGLDKPHSDIVPVLSLLWPWGLIPA